MGCMGSSSIKSYPSAYTGLRSCFCPYTIDDKITIKRDLATQEMRCPCGFSHVNSAIVRKHAQREHKTGDRKTAILSNGRSSQPGPSTSRSVSSIETASSVRSVSPVQNSDTPPTSRASASLSSLSKGAKAATRVISGATPQRNPLDMVEKKISKSVASRTTADHPLSVSTWKKLAEEARADAASRKSVQTSSLFKRQSDVAATPPVASTSSREAVQQKSTSSTKKPAAPSSAVPATKHKSVEK